MKLQKNRRKRPRRRGRRVFAPVMGERRATLNRIRSRAIKFGFKESDVRPIQLRLYALLKNNISGLTFKVAQETQVHSMEIRLEKSDAFYCDKVGFALHKVLIDGGTEIPANTPMIHYPDPNWFAAANQARDMEGLYNSQMFVKTDQDVRLEQFDTALFRKVPRQQYVPASAGVLQQWWETNGEELYDIQTNFGLWGNKRNEFEIKFGDGSYANIAGDGTSHNNYGVILLQGFKLVRGAEAVTVSDANLIFRG